MVEMPERKAKARSFRGEHESRYIWLPSRHCGGQAKEQPRLHYGKPSSLSDNGGDTVQHGQADSRATVL